ncbi:serine/threonine-protein kinase RsbT [Allocatelliglobosispora scoriae]|uniref:Serine/threonine-protein kinase RsbT n=1 Tax=Allocatelliglobosispora scoriae TaxID=643052 RepID=A0A841C2B1_9ACTN|nr:ATP-binding protein [Allocatelliglobosispora scoriae]MBB5873439.1 serine/threonine-protein kinase RsbT [Allocatelliglobosispora scoriae]
MIDVEALGPARRQEIAADDDVVRVRQLVRAAAVESKLSLVDQTKLVTAASELARNTLVYGGGGYAEVQPVSNGRRRGIRVVFADEGPGIADLDQAFTDGYTTGGGLGLGLSGARRLMDEFELHTEVGAGTVITAVKWER